MDFLRSFGFKSLEGRREDVGVRKRKPDRTKKTNSSAILFTINYIRG